MGQRNGQSCVLLICTGYLLLYGQTWLNKSLERSHERARGCSSVFLRASLGKNVWFVSGNTPSIIIWRRKTFGAKCCVMALWFTGTVCVRSALNILCGCAWCVCMYLWSFIFQARTMARAMDKRSSFAHSVVFLSADELPFALRKNVNTPKNSPLTQKEIKGVGAPYTRKQAKRREKTWKLQLFCAWNLPGNFRNAKEKCFEGGVWFISAGMEFGTLINLNCSHDSRQAALQRQSIFILVQFPDATRDEIKVKLLESSRRLLISQVWLTVTTSFYPVKTFSFETQDTRRSQNWFCVRFADLWFIFCMEDLCY